MFTGIIEAVGTIRSLQDTGGDKRIVIDLGKLDQSAIGIGDSIAVSGVCLTAVQLDAGCMTADVSVETLDCTVLGELEAGNRVNLERAMQLSDRLDGHIVSGHVDGVGDVVERADDGRSVRFGLRAPSVLAKYIAAKGSVCIDGVSLTVNAIDGDVFELNIVPHTLQETTLGEFQPGRRVNIEVDVIARYLERLTAGATHGTG